MNRTEKIVLSSNKSVQVKRLTVVEVTRILEESEERLKGSGDDNSMTGLVNQLALEDIALDDLLDMTDLSREQLYELDMGDIELIAERARKLNPHFFAARSLMMKIIRRVVGNMDQFALEQLGLDSKLREEASSGLPAPLPAAVTEALSGITRSTSSSPPVTS